jgi:hypothetical protein
MTAVDLEGAWRTEQYVVKGESHDVVGVLLLTANRWATLYFVRTPTGPWGSGEAGSYAVSDGRITFHHELMLQAGGDRTLNIDTEASHVETCNLVLNGEHCTIRFPSGNDLKLRRMHP